MHREGNSLLNGRLLVLSLNLLPLRIGGDGEVMGGEGKSQMRSKVLNRRKFIISSKSFWKMTFSFFSFVLFYI